MAVEEIVKVVEPIVEPVEAPIVEPVVEAVKTKQELLREISKEYGINLFEAEGIQKFKEYQDSQKSATDKLNEQLEAYKSKETEWTSKTLDYESKLKATELGIPLDRLDDVKKLADNDPSKYEEVLKKYPAFKTTDGIKIGVQNPNNSKTPSGLSEAEQYMAKNSRIYGDKK